MNANGMQVRPQSMRINDNYLKAFQLVAVRFTAGVMLATAAERQRMGVTFRLKGCKNYGINSGSGRFGHVSPFCVDDA